MPNEKLDVKLPLQKMLDGLKLFGSNGGGVDPRIDIPRFYELRSQATQKFDPSHTILQLYKKISPDFPCNFIFPIGFY